MFGKLINDYRFFLIVAFMLTVIKFQLTRLTGIWFPTNQHYDDELMMKYADFPTHFSSSAEPFNEVLLKDMGFPFFLNLIHEVGINYFDALSMLWFIAATSSVFLFAKTVKNSNKVVLLAIFAFVLFTPAAFDAWCGTRLYRSSILAPLYFIILNMSAIIFVRSFYDVKINLIKFLPYQIFLGLIFTLTFYVKEDGIWLLAVLICIFVLCFIKVLRQKTFSTSYKILYVVALLLPLMIFFGGTVAYKNVNQKYFGVYEINTRTGGETGKFVNLVYKIKSDERTGKIWAPADAIVKAIEISDTFKDNPQFTESILHSPWAGGDIFQNPIKGDFLGWVVITAVKDSGVFSNLAEQENFFRKVNQEIEIAFENGTLQKDSKIQIVSSMGGRSLVEILKLSKYMLQLYGMHVILYEYNPGAMLIARNAPANVEEEILTNTAEKLTGINLLQQNETAGPMNETIDIIFMVYKFLQFVLFVMAVVGTFLAIKKLLKRKTNFDGGELLAIFISLGSFLLAMVYSLAIAWFCEFIDPSELRHAALKFYGVGLIPMFMTFEIFGTYLLYSNYLKTKIGDKLCRK